MNRTAREKTARAASRHSLSWQMHDIVASRGLTAYRLGKLAGVDPGVIQRWMNGERDIRMETADRIADVLRLRLVEIGAKGKSGRYQREVMAFRKPETAELGGVDETSTDGDPVFGESAAVSEDPSDV
jgi:transcriptional regulator with XRE-family HTH domain